MGEGEKLYQYGRLRTEIDRGKHSGLKEKMTGELRIKIDFDMSRQPPRAYVGWKGFMEAGHREPFSSIRQLGMRSARRWPGYEG